MAKPILINVTAPEGRATPIPKRDAVEPGGALLIVVPGKVAAVAFSQEIRRSIARGDLRRCNADGSMPDGFNAAAAGKDKGK